MKFLQHWPGVFFTPIYSGERILHPFHVPVTTGPLERHHYNENLQRWLRY